MRRIYQSIIIGFSILAMACSAFGFMENPYSSMGQSARMVESITAGTLTITSGSITDSSGAISFGNENLSTTGNLAGATYGPDSSISNAELLKIDDGAVTEIIVGGGAGSAFNWGTDLPTAVTIGTKYIYRADGTDVPVADGGTGASTFALNGVLYGNGASAIGATAIGAEGSILVAGASPFVPVFSIGTGTGAPVRATSPTIATPVITSIVPGANFTLTQNSVSSFTSEEAGAIANTLYLKAGNVGIGTIIPGANFTVSGLEGLAGTINLWADDGDDPADKFAWSMSAAGVLTETIGGTTTRTVAADGSVDFPLAVTAQSLTADPSSAPGINFIDSDGADLDVSGKIYNNLTATGSGAEVGDLYFQAMGAQGTAGTLATAFYWKGSDRNLILYGSVIPGQETITCASDVCTENIKLQTHFIVSEGGAEVDADLLTLDNGTTAGQEVTFIFKTESDAGDTIVIDTAQQVGWSDFTMAEVGDSVTFVWDGTNWTIKAYYQAGTY